jgi:SSS family solute:Na+ symporter
VLLFHETESAALGLCQLLFGKASLVAGTTLATVDPSWVALPCSGLTTLVATLATKPDAVQERPAAPAVAA